MALDRDPFPDTEAETLQTHERRRLCQIWLRKSDYFTDGELFALIEFLELWRDAGPRARASALSRLLPR